MMNGAYYYHTEYFPITDFTQPGKAYENALACAEKHGDTKAATGASTLKRAHNDAGEIIGYTVRSRHLVGDVGSDHPDRVKDNPGDVR